MPATAAAAVTAAAAAAAAEVTERVRTHSVRGWHKTHHKHTRIFWLPEQARVHAQGRM
jgi:hypothetical protein